ncbi:hypothetical protein NS365_05040 [Aureimonas ureilytica]|uniref:Uncharacterized protein n=1 Tax=Aureimonas ureilytica TaxID=401562 RepID=A0A175RVW9_9HYPH|nr:hypothetical protein [Aureimonas ureilytica]KTR07022.1 hypothetical protein NS365_05040 [Aureimonas ureilytica]
MFGSCYDTERFVWLTRERGPIGPRCDAWIEDALRARRIGLYACEQRAIDASDPAILQAALGMGAERMASVLALATDADGRVRLNELGSLLPHLRFLLERWLKEGSIPLRDVVEHMHPTAGRDDDPEAAGRLATQMLAALGQALARTEMVPERRRFEVARRPRYAGRQSVGSRRECAPGKSTGRHNRASLVWPPDWQRPPRFFARSSRCDTERASSS